MGILEDCSPFVCVDSKVAGDFRDLFLTAKGLPRVWAWGGVDVNTLVMCDACFKVGMTFYLLHTSHLQVRNCKIA